MSILQHQDLHEFVALLEARGELRRVTAPVAAELEITAIVERLSRGPAAQNKALLFENVAGYELPVLVNAFGSAQRMAWALHVEELEALNSLLQALRAAGVSPRRVRRGPCQELVATDSASLDGIPILTCWPKDGGPFITLPQVVTRHPETGVRNVGMYRLQKVDSRTLLVHWQRHKGGAEHERVARESAVKDQGPETGAPKSQLRNPKSVIPAAVVLGGDPACIDEYLLAGWLRGRPVEFVRCVTQPLTVPANADMVIEGYVDPADQRPEGPFGDHTGYYTPVEFFPAFHVTAITRRRDALYPATVVGVPPMEDYWMGKATERLFLPLLRLFLPEVVDLAMPAPGVFHNLVLVSINKRYPGQARKVIHGLWGLALLSLAKAVVVVDGWVDVQDPMTAAWQALGNVDWSRDVLIGDGPVDQLDHASYQPAFGGKIGIDATAKWPEEGYTRQWPEVARMSPEVTARIAALWETLGL